MYLDLKYNLLGDKSGDAFIAALKVNTKIKTFIFEKNLIKFDLEIELRQLLGENRENFNS